MLVFVEVVIIDVFLCMWVNWDDIGLIVLCIVIGLRLLGNYFMFLVLMKKSISLWVVIIVLVVVVYSIYMYVQQLISGCMWVRGYQCCSFENSMNFEGWMDLDLMIICCWVVVVVVGWIFVVQGMKKMGQQCYVCFC